MQNAQRTTRRHTIRRTRCFFSQTRTRQPVRLTHTRHRLTDRRNLLIRYRYQQRDNRSRTQTTALTTPITRWHRQHRRLPLLIVVMAQTTNVAAGLEHRLGTRATRTTRTRRSRSTQQRTSQKQQDQKRTDHRTPSSTPALAKSSDRLPNAHGYHQCSERPPMRCSAVFCGYPRIISSYTTADNTFFSERVQRPRRLPWPCKPEIIN